MILFSKHSNIYCDSVVVISILQSEIAPIVQQINWYSQMIPNNLNKRQTSCLILFEGKQMKSTIDTRLVTGLAGVDRQNTTHNTGIINTACSRFGHLCPFLSPSQRRSVMAAISVPHARRPPITGTV
jgi:hypothetical protein